MKNQELFDGCLVISPLDDLNAATIDMPPTAGVCLFANAKNQPILLLCGANLRTLVRRRLHQDAAAEKTRRTPLRPIVERIWFRRSYSAFETQWAYYNAAAAVYPDRFAEFFPRLDAWFITVNPDDKYPCFNQTSQLNISSPSKNDGVPSTSRRPLYWGPFSAKKSATRFLDTLQNLFDLCRHPHLLAQAPHAAGCPYAQMNRCAAVCNGSVNLDHYRKIIQKTIDFLNHPIARGIDALEKQMKKSAADLQFETAQNLKEKLSQAQKLLSADFQWIAPLDQFYLLLFQSGPKYKIPRRRAALPTVTPFIISPDRITQIEPFLLEQAHDAAHITLDHLNLIQMQKKPPHRQNLAWIARFLYRKSQDQGLLTTAADAQNHDELAQKIVQHFTRPKINYKKPKLDTLSLTSPEKNELPEN